MTSPSTQREFALDVVEQLRAAGFEALWAGGCVRDQLMGLVPKDYDVATSAKPDEVRALFGHRRTLAIGAAFGVVTVLGRKPLEPIEVATFRTDVSYADGRRPEEVVFSTAEEDAARRDFTINGLFFDPVTEEVVDYVGGRQDLHDGVLRAIGDPTARFTEDKLRMLRAVRFSANLGFELDSATEAAVREMAGDISVVSAERIGAELRRMLTHHSRRRGVLLLHATRLLNELFPTLAALVERDDAAWQRTLTALERLEGDSLPAAFAVLHYELGDADEVRTRGRTFRFTNQEIDVAAWITAEATTVRDAATVAWPRLQRMLVQPTSANLIEAAAALLGADHPGVVRCREQLAAPREAWNPAPLLTGDDLIAAGHPPGRRFGPLLDAVRDAQLNGELATPDEALHFAEQWLKQNTPKNR